MALPTQGNLVTFQVAKGQLNLDHDLDDEMVDTIRFNASNSVLDYLKQFSYLRGPAPVTVGTCTRPWRPSDGPWTPDASDNIGASTWIDSNGEPTDDVPGNVRAATQLMIGAMYENRDGDAWRSPQPLSQAAIDLLWRLRDPAMA